MLARVRSCAIAGLYGRPIDVEVDVSGGLPSFTIVGLPDASVSEAKERIKAAFRNAGIEFPRTKITVNLAPADLKKEGGSFDLAIACGILLAQEEHQFDAQYSFFIGELGLDGGVRKIFGALPIALAAIQHGVTQLFLPRENLNEAEIIPGLSVFGLKNIRDLAGHVRGVNPLVPYVTSGVIPKRDLGEFEIDISQITGHAHAKRALEIAAAGGHHLMLFGPPGTGKTLLARALVGILPSMSHDEMIDVSCIYSISGMLQKDQSIIQTRPFRSPHHSASPAAIIGGGTNPRPGEVSLAHRGILFLDEIPEFSRNTLECLRQPLEDGFVHIARASAHARFPARFTLVAAQNPCPCGFAGDPDKHCSCPPNEVERYKRKVSGPLLDRIDMACEVPRIAYRELKAGGTGESSSAPRARVERAREIARERFMGRPFETNAEMNISDVRIFCSLDEAGSKILEQAADKMHLSPRGITRVLKVARTIADLAGAEEISAAHVLEAVQYRLTNH